MSLKVKIRCSTFVIYVVYLEVACVDGEHLALLEHDRLVHDFRGAGAEGAHRGAEGVRHTYEHKRRRR